MQVNSEFLLSIDFSLVDYAHKSIFISSIQWLLLPCFGGGKLAVATIILSFCAAFLFGAISRIFIREAKQHPIYDEAKAELSTAEAEDPRKVLLLSSDKN